MNKTIVIIGEQQFNAAVSVIRSNWRAMSDSGHPMAVHMVEHKERRSLEQQGLMWIRLGEIAEQAYVDGRRYSDVIWHRHAKEQFLPEEDGPTKSCRKGYKKWDYLPNGTRELVGSTTQLTTYGMSQYQLQLEAMGAEMGVLYSSNPNERF